MSVDADARKKNKKKVINIAIVFLISVAFPLLPPIGQVTHAGMQVLGIFLGVLYGWVTIDLGFPSLLGLILIGLTDAINTTTFFQQGFGSQLGVMIICIVFISAAIVQMDLSSVIVGWLMNLKISRGRPWVKVFCFLLACNLVAILSMGVVSAFIFVPLYLRLIELAEIPPYHRLNYVFFLGIAVVVMLGEICLPFRPLVLVVMAMVNPYMPPDGGITMASYLCVLPLTIFLIAFYVLICKYILRIDASTLTKLDNTTISIGDGKITKKQSTFLIMVGIFLLTLVAPSVLPKAWKITSMLSILGNGGISLMFLFIMMVIHIDGEPLIDLKQLTKDFNWDIVIMMVFFSPISNLISSPDLGISSTISAFFQPILGGLSPMMFVLAMGIIVTVLTNLFNNFIIEIIFITIASILSATVQGINLAALSVVILLCANLSMVLPSANFITAYLFSFKEISRFRAQALVGLVTCAILCVFSCTAGYLYLCLFL